VIDPSRDAFGAALRWPQYNISAEQMPILVDGTGWKMERHVKDGEDHAVLLRRL